MRFPLNASLLLLLQSRVSSFAACSAPVSSLSFAFVHKSNHNKTSTSLRATLSSDTPKAKLSDDLLNEIASAAKSSRSISSTSTKVSEFAGLQYVNTSELSAKKQHRVIFILGGPGAGKGTQSERIVNTYKCIHLSVGELLRQERERGDSSPHAELIESCLVAGKIVPVEISLNLVRNAMDEASAGGYGAPIFLVDGFPRNFDNLEGWTREMPEYAAVIGSLVYDCPIDVLEKRIMARAETSGRSDDNLESARKRFKTFQGQTMPVVYALEEVEKNEIDEKGMSTLHICHIRGEGTVEEVWGTTQDAMNNYVMNDVLTANAQLISAIENSDVEQYANLCSPEMMKGANGEELSKKEAFHKLEFGHDSKGNMNILSHGSVQVRDGTKATVNYTRRIIDEDGNLQFTFKEQRVWSHGERGWICVHFTRKPMTEP